MTEFVNPLHSLKDEASGDAARELRQITCIGVVECFADAGALLVAASILNEDTSIEGLALVTLVAAQLADGIGLCFVSGNYYAGSALVRQLIEAQYFLARFADDPDAAPRWVEASSNQIDQHFRPSALRQGGRFSASEYKVHCRLGGHPDPFGRWLLPHHLPPIPLHMLWVDFAQHLSEAWGDLSRCVAESADPTILGDLPEIATALIERWRAEDPWSGRIVLPKV